MANVKLYALIFFIFAEASSDEDVKKESRNKKDVIDEVASATTPELAKLAYGITPYQSAGYGGQYGQGGGQYGQQGGQYGQGGQYVPVVQPGQGGQYGQYGQYGQFGQYIPVGQYPTGSLGTSPGNYYGNYQGQWSQGNFNGQYPQQVPISGQYPSHQGGWFGSGYNPGSGGYNPGSGGYNPGSGGYNPGSGGYNPGSGGYNPGSGGYVPAAGYNPGYNPGYNQGYYPYNPIGGSNNYYTSGISNTLSSLFPGYFKGGFTGNPYPTSYKGHPYNSGYYNGLYSSGYYPTYPQNSYYNNYNSHYVNKFQKSSPYGAPTYSTYPSTAYSSPTVYTAASSVAANRQVRKSEKSEE